MSYNPKITMIMETLGITLFVFLIGVAVVRAQEAKSVYKVYVGGLSCPFCAYGIEKKFSAVEGVEEIDIDLKTGTTFITMATGKTLDETTARKAVKSAGFTLRDFEQVQVSPKNKE